MCFYVVKRLVMISIVVCSLHENLLKQLKDNIAQTIGVSFEVLVWQNKEASLGICEVYNRVATNASFPLFFSCMKMFHLIRLIGERI